MEREYDPWGVVDLIRFSAHPLKGGYDVQMAASTKMSKPTQRGRPISDLDLIERLDGPRQQRRRTRFVLATLTGDVTIAEACAQLGIGRTRCYVLRRRMLGGMLDALTPRRSGRPPQPGDSGQVDALQARIRELEAALQTTALQSEIALATSSLRAHPPRTKTARAR